eukprot:4600618-Amphidinium_carterae.1
MFEKRNLYNLLGLGKSCDQSCNWNGANKQQPMTQNNLETAKTGKNGKLGERNEMAKLQLLVFQPLCSPVKYSPTINYYVRQFFASEFN